MTTPVRVLLWFSLACLPYASGEYWSKRFSFDGSFWSAAFSVVSYALSTLCWLAIMRTSSKLFVWGVAWQPMGCGIAFVLGVICFGERLHWTELVGIGLAVVAVGFLILGPSVAGDVR